MTAAEEQEHEASLLYVVGRVNHGIRREMHARLAPWKLSVQQYTTLSVLETRPGLSNAQLARRALVTPQSMLEILAKLEERGLVTRAVDPAHALILRAELTPEGRKLLTETTPAIREIEDELLDGVADRHRKVVLRVMTQAMSRLSER
jgi:DNA-binding MarR family transcriptional regulator